MFAKTMHEPLAQAIAEAGFHVLTLDFLGHGESDQPHDKREYSMVRYGQQVVGLLDHIGVDQAVLMGSSLGANSSLEVAAAAPERVRGLVIEMPVLESALLGCAIAFTPALMAFTFASPIVRGHSRLAQRVPRWTTPWIARLGLDVLSREPEPSAAVMQGLFFGRVAPPREMRQAMQMPAIVLGHQHDPIHPFSDAGMLAEEMPNATFVRTGSILELRFAPPRLVAPITDFCAKAWS
jgi:pimeloyl-ACP methyl ester carboxylesterase